MLGPVRGYAHGGRGGPSACLSTNRLVPQPVSSQPWDLDIVGPFVSWASPRSPRGSFSLPEPSAQPLGYHPSSFPTPPSWALLGAADVSQGQAGVARVAWVCLLLSQIPGKPSLRILLNGPEITDVTLLKISFHRWGYLRLKNGAGIAQSPTIFGTGLELPVIPGLE